MKRPALVFTLLLGAVASAAAQNGLYQPILPPQPNVTARPVIETLFPLAIIDEADLPDLAPAEYPPLPWRQAQTCLAAHGVPVDFREPPPPLRLVDSAAATFRVHDVTLDSLAPQHAGLGGPTIGYTLVRSGLVIVVARYARNIPLLRHEAIHWLLWHAMPERREETFGHPEQWFGPCDRYYE